MDKSMKRKCYIIYMEDMLSQNNADYKYVVEECILVEPIHMV